MKFGPPGALGFINHLLAGEDWARDRLTPFAGQTVRLETGVLARVFEITADGFFASADDEAPITVTIALPADAPLRALIDRPALFAAAQISGSAELAETIGFLFRNLRWDVESDLAGLVGDIAARRLVEGGKRIRQWQAEQATNLAHNLAEYFSEEDPLLARRRDLADFCGEVAALQERFLQIERRIAALES
jgi:ubiquinone biosynthesis accessory factor UbiJ